MIIKLLHGKSYPKNLKTAGSSRYKIPRLTTENIPLMSDKWYFWSVEKGHMLTPYIITTPEFIRDTSSKISQRMCWSRVASTKSLMWVQGCPSSKYKGFCRQNFSEVKPTLLKMYLNSSKFVICSPNFGPSSFFTSQPKQKPSTRSPRGFPQAQHGPILKFLPSCRPCDGFYLDTTRSERRL